jgi:hypothetical protein
MITSETLKSASPTSREVVVTDLPEATTTSKQLFTALVDATIEQLGITTHTAKQPINQGSSSQRTRGADNYF